MLPNLNYLPLDAGRAPVITALQSKGDQIGKSEDEAGSADALHHR
jgi:hypothetical protein